MFTKTHSINFNSTFQDFSLESDDRNRVSVIALKHINVLSIYGIFATYTVKNHKNNKTENPFSLKDDEREMTSKTKPMSTCNLKNPLIPIFTIPNVDIYNIL